MAKNRFSGWSKRSKRSKRPVQAVVVPKDEENEERLTSQCDTKEVEGEPTKKGVDLKCMKEIKINVENIFYGNLLTPEQRRKLLEGTCLSSSPERLKDQTSHATLSWGSSSIGDVSPLVQELTGKKRQQQNRESFFAQEGTSVLRNLLSRETSDMLNGDSFSGVKLMNMTDQEKSSMESETKVRGIRVKRRRISESDDSKYDFNVSTTKGSRSKRTRRSTASKKKLRKIKEEPIVHIKTELESPTKLTEPSTSTTNTRQTRSRGKSSKASANVGHNKLESGTSKIASQSVNSTMQTHRTNNLRNPFANATAREMELFAQINGDPRMEDFNNCLLPHDRNNCSLDSIAQAIDNDLAAGNVLPLDDPNAIDAELLNLRGDSFPGILDCHKPLISLTTNNHDCDSNTLPPNLSPQPSDSTNRIRKRKLPAIIKDDVLPRGTVGISEDALTLLNLKKQKKVAPKINIISGTKKTDAASGKKASNIARNNCQQMPQKSSKVSIYNPCFTGNSSNVEQTTPGGTFFKADEHPATITNSSINGIDTLNNNLGHGVSNKNDTRNVKNTAGNYVYMGNWRASPPNPDILEEMRAMSELLTTMDEDEAMTNLILPIKSNNEEKRIIGEVHAPDVELGNLTTQNLSRFSENSAGPQPTIDSQNENENMNSKTTRYSEENASIERKRRWSLHNKELKSAMRSNGKIKLVRKKWGTGNDWELEKCGVGSPPPSHLSSSSNGDNLKANSKNDQFSSSINEKSRAIVEPVSNDRFQRPANSLMNVDSTHPEEGPLEDLATFGAPCQIDAAEKPVEYEGESSKSCHFGTNSSASSNSSSSSSTSDESHDENDGNDRKSKTSIDTGIKTESNGHKIQMKSQDSPKRAQATISIGEISSPVKTQKIQARGSLKNIAPRKLSQSDSPTKTAKRDEGEKNKTRVSNSPTKRTEQKDDENGCSMQNGETGSEEKKFILEMWAQKLEPLRKKSQNISKKNCVESGFDTNANELGSNIEEMKSPTDAIDLHETQSELDELENLCDAETMAVPTNTADSEEKVDTAMEIDSCEEADDCISLFTESMCSIQYSPVHRPSKQPTTNQQRSPVSQHYTRMKSANIGKFVAENNRECDAIFEEYKEHATETQTIFARPTTAENQPVFAKPNAIADYPIARNIAKPDLRSTLNSRVISRDIPSLFKGQCFSWLRLGQCTLNTECSFRHGLKPQLQELQKLDLKNIEEILHYSIKKYYRHFVEVTLSKAFTKMTTQHIKALCFQLSNVRMFTAPIIETTYDALILRGLSPHEIITHFDGILNSGDGESRSLIMCTLYEKIEPGHRWHTLKCMMLKSAPAKQLVEWIITEAIEKNCPKHAAEVFQMMVGRLSYAKTAMLQQDLLKRFELLRTNTHIASIASPEMQNVLTINTDCNVTQTIASPESPEPMHQPIVASFSEPMRDVSLADRVHYPTDFYTSPGSQKMGSHGRVSESSDHKQSYQMPVIDELPSPKSVYRDKLWKFHWDLQGVQESLKYQDYAHVISILEQYAEDPNRVPHIVGFYNILCKEITSSKQHMAEIIRRTVQSGSCDALRQYVYDLGFYVLTKLADVGLWLHAYELLKSLHIYGSYNTCAFTLLAAEIYIANRRPLKALALLRQSRIIFTNSRMWYQTHCPNDESVRVIVIDTLLYSLCDGHSEQALRLLDFLLIDQSSTFKPINLDPHVNRIALVLLSRKRTSLVVDIGRLILQAKLLVPIKTFRALINRVFHDDLLLARQLHRYSTWLGAYNRPKINGATCAHMVVNTNWTEEETFLMISSLIEDLYMNIGHAVDRLKMRDLNIFLVFEEIPTEQALSKDECGPPITANEMSKRKAVVKSVLDRFDPKIKMVQRYRGRICKLQGQSLIAYLKSGQVMR